MQNTRINSLFNVGLTIFYRWFRNPWRRISLLLISLLFGNFLATALATIAGQAADWDVVAAMILAVAVEIASWLFYGRVGRQVSDPVLGRRTLLFDMLNGIKVGLTYGLFLEAFKLGS